MTEEQSNVPEKFTGGRLWHRASRSQVQEIWFSCQVKSWRSSENVGLGTREEKEEERKGFTESSIVTCTACSG
ncbi:hypothetical protein RRG08_050244 [Elysia crispata]|uniref:Uncharacterized protein n=1 Tax=Elysia crispata TaxID=231223 RepID=A0AAE1B459_9GAST|nr:hypothetical protein RRG08_050244 [Elysia crispata]